MQYIASVVTLTGQRQNLPREFYIFKNVCIYFCNVNTRFTKMEDIYMSGEGSAGRRIRQANAGLCTVQRNAGRMATLAQWRCKSIRVSTYFLKLFYSFLILSLLEAHTSWQLNLDQNVLKKSKIFYVYIYYFSEVEVAMTCTGKLCFHCL